MCIMAATRLGQSPETDQSEIPNAEQILSALKKRLNQFSYLINGEPDGVHLNPLLSPYYFIFIGIF